MLLQIVRELDLRPDSVALDVGCGAGTHSFRLATHFGLQVLGVDPVQRNLDLAREARRDEPEEIASRVTFGRGSATELPVSDSSVDLVWCRDVLVHVSSLDAAYAEFARVLRPGGRAVVYQFVATPLLSSAEAACAVPGDGCRAVLDVDRRSPTRRWPPRAWWSTRRSTSGRSGVSTPRRSPASAARALLRAARLQREPDRYRSAMGAAAYDVVLGDSLWQVYRMLGKLSGGSWC